MYMYMQSCTCTIINNSLFLVPTVFHHKGEWSANTLGYNYKDIIIMIFITRTIDQSDTSMIPRQQSVSHWHVT